jgi:hypothetical protein
LGIENVEPLCFQSLIQPSWVLFARSSKLSCHFVLNAALSSIGSSNLYTHAVIRTYGLAGKATRYCKMIVSAVFMPKSWIPADRKFFSKVFRRCADTGFLARQTGVTSPAGLDPVRFIF